MFQNRIHWGELGWVYIQIVQQDSSKILGSYHGVSRSKDFSDSLGPLSTGLPIPVPDFTTTLQIGIFLYEVPVLNLLTKKGRKRNPPRCLPKVEDAGRREVFLRLPGFHPRLSLS